MRYLRDKSSNKIKCGFCNKYITDKDEIEYSREYCIYFCCPDHASTYYFEEAGSTPVDFAEAQEMIEKDIYGWNFNH